MTEPRTYLYTVKIQNAFFSIRNTIRAIEAEPMTNIKGKIKAIDFVIDCLRDVKRAYIFFDNLEKKGTGNDEPPTTPA